MERDVRLPILHNETVLLDMDPYAVKTYNLIQAQIVINAIDSERKDMVCRSSTPLMFSELTDLAPLTGLSVPSQGKWPQPALINVFILSSRQNVGALRQLVDNMSQYVVSDFSASKY